MYLNQTNSIKILLIRILVFLVLFIALTGITGPWIISTRLLYGFNFFIYGNLGKMVIYSSFIFLLLTRGRLSTFKVEKYRWTNLICIIASFILLPVFFTMANRLLMYPSFYANFPASLFTHALLITMAALLVPGVFGFRMIQEFIARFKKELAICIVISLVYDFLIFQVWKLWPYLSALVLYTEAFLFKLSFPTVIVTPPNILIVQTFSVAIAEACSGLDSLFLFSSLYIMIAILDWKVFNKAKLIIMFFPVSLGLIAINILRVYLLIWIGVMISPQLTLTLFHTYAGMVLFIIYFIVFWKLSYKWMRKQ